ncbi:heparan sulfate 2-O-sulfotransferase pipe [Tribolium castaneum]|nr:PREDICTED: heparan sulfate 2-O-sulfotransferase pipe [Tribolium castaneum]|eukprot:XP_969659.3 PREDICTED: heparan sulfate 2-O-sulfotransferase pipe [Tribolium castaneum]
MDFLWRYRRFSIPKRTSELVAFIAISATLFLFMHTRDLHSKLKEMEVKLQPEDIATGDELETGAEEIRATIKILQTSKEVTRWEPYQVNNTLKAQQNIVFFNRVPKVGSQTLMELIRRLSIRNNFGFHQDRVQRVETIRLSPEDQAVLSSLVSSYEPPGVYIKHVCFTNISRFGFPEPIYINLVRDPVERVISWYYYVRAPWYYVERKIAFPDIPLPDPKWLKKDFEHCVLSGDRECKYLTGETREGIGDHRRQSMFFCGHHSECLPFNTPGALERAKRVVEQHYAVVGVLEDLNTTLTVLEKYIPRFFTGAYEIYWNEISRFNPINKNAFKPPVSETVKNIVRQNFTKEIEFYQFCKQRLHKQYSALQLDNKT